MTEQQFPYQKEMLPIRHFKPLGFSYHYQGLPHGEIPYARALTYRKGHIHTNSLVFRSQDPLFLCQRHVIQHSAIKKGAFCHVEYPQ